MKTITQTWKQPLAALALLASLNTAPDAAQAGPIAPTTVAAAPAPTAAPAGVASVTIATSSRTPAATEPATEPVPASSGRFPAPNGGPFGGQNNNFSRQPTLEQIAIQNELQRTVDTVRYDMLPLTEVINNLVELTSANGKTPVNFILSRERPSATQVGTIDPATGLPIANADPIDWSAVAVSINPALRHVRLIDVLEVIVKSADKPIKYSIENYGVVFSQDTSRDATPQPAAVGAPYQPPLEVRTFKVDTNTFFTGLTHTFGIPGPSNGFGAKAREETQGVLAELLKKLGISMDNPEKSIFYNDVTGIVMMRGTLQDLAVMDAAIETLGGSHMPVPSTANVRRP